MSTPRSTRSAAAPRTARSSSSAPAASSPCQSTISGSDIEGPFTVAQDTLRCPRKQPLAPPGRSGRGLLALLLFRLTHLLRRLLLAPALLELGHVLAQAERPHVGPHFVHVGAAFGARAF